MGQPEQFHERSPYQQWRKPEEVIAFYTRWEKPLTKDMLRALIEPLAGTSFATMALAALRKEFTIQREREESKPYRIMPSTIYFAFFKEIGDANVEAYVQGSERDAAELALWSHLSHNVGVSNISYDKRLSPGELAFCQLRTDTVWYDPQHIREAFNHEMGQWLLYKDGLQVGNIPMRSIYYLDQTGFHYTTIIPEGSPRLPLFHDGRLPGVAAVAPSLQAYTGHSRLLFVSEQFDFHLALKKQKPPESRRP